jgi:hypothetical protein
MLNPASFACCFRFGACPYHDLAFCIWATLTVARRRTVDSISQSQVLVLESLLRLLWISDEYCRASHELPPDLEISLFIARIVEPVSSADNPKWGHGLATNSGRA